MANCPHCGRELVPDPKNPGKVLCYNCKKRFNEASVSRAQQAPQQAPMPQQAPQQTYQQMPQPTAQPMSQGYAPDMSQQYQMPRQGYQQMPNQMPQQMPGQVPGQYPQGIPGYPQPSLPKGTAIVALVLAILALLGFWLPVLNVGCIIIAAVAIFLGINAKKKASRGEGGGKPAAIAAIVIAVLAIVGSLGVTACTMALTSSLQDGEKVTLFDFHVSTDGDDKKGESVLSTDANDEASDEVLTTGTVHSANSDKYPNMMVSDPDEESLNIWANNPIIFDGTNVIFGEMTLREFIEKTGWVPTDEWSENTKKTLGKGMVFNFYAENPKYPGAVIMVGIANGTAQDIPCMDCPMSMIDVQEGALAGNTVSFKIANGVELGKTPMTTIINKLGYPQNFYEKDPLIGVEYTDEEEIRILQCWGEDPSEPITEIAISTKGRK